MPNTSHWVTVYPAYINARLKVSEGRRIAKGLAVDNPQLQEISMILTLLRIMHVAELMKAYSRDVLSRGRIKVQLKLPDGSLANPEVPTSNLHSEKALLKKLGELIPRLKTRVEGGQEVEETTAGKKDKKNKKKKS